MPNFHSAMARRLSACSRKVHNLPLSDTSIHPVVAMNDGAPCGAAVIELLEKREMLSVSQNGGGWTVVTPSAGDRVIYVSSSQGSDHNSGLSSSAPVQSIARGESLLRNNSGDQLLLKRGDTWNQSLGFWSKSGSSPQNPIVVGAYGSGARPTLATGNSSALVSGGAPMDNVDLIGIHMYPNARSGSGPDGISVDSRVDHFLIEDCDIEGYKNNITFEKYFGTMSNITVRRSIVANAWSGTGAHSQGLFADGVQGITLQDNLFNHNGWNPSRGGYMTIFNHDVYITAENSGLVATGNIFANASNFGLEARSGGIVENNVFYNDADGLEFGLVDGAPLTAGGVSGIVSGNAFFGSHTIGGVSYGSGLLVGNIRSATITNNIFSHNSVGKVAAISLEVGAGNSNFNSAVGLNNLNVTNNIVYAWYEGIWIAGGLHPGGSGPYALNNVNVSGNSFVQTKNRSTGTYYPGIGGIAPSAAGGYSDPSRSLDSYGAAVGVGGSATAFLAAAQNQSSTGWNGNLTANAFLSYLRAGF